MANDSEVWLLWLDLGLSWILSALEVRIAAEPNNAKDSSALGSLKIMYDYTQRHIKIRLVVRRGSSKASIGTGLGHFRGLMSLGAMCTGVGRLPPTYAIATGEK
jgi:hypothetical protein